MAKELTTPIDTLLARGTTQPLYVATIAANGTMVTGMLMFEADAAVDGLICTM